jgi:hypothetical protein
MAKTTKKYNISLILSLVILSLIILTVFFSIRTHNQYEILKDHRNYLKQQNIEIQSWMTINTVVNRFNMTNDYIYSELGIDNTYSWNRMTIQSICIKKKLDCTKIVANLNSLRSK